MNHVTPAIPFIFSIEIEPGISHRHGFHLGTYEKLAREIAVEKYDARVAAGLPVITVALIRDGKMVDCYGGRWFNT